jgi:hypothetical protein
MILFKQDIIKDDGFLPFSVTDHPQSEVSGNTEDLFKENQNGSL